MNLMIHRVTALLPILILAGAGPLLADAPVDHAPEGNVWVAYLIAIFLIAGVIVVNSLSSKRGHRD